ncbi:MAG TPA: YciI family protein [Chloroflexota bacterium]|nr:YciI family protein [Chloroflexota bacterium]
MRYALLIYMDEKLAPQRNSEADITMSVDYQAFGERYKDKILGGDALQAVATARTVQVRGGQTLATDGPFAETKEQLNGFYLVECGDLDEAVEVASHIPDAVRGSIEIRPIMEFN